MSGRQVFSPTTPIDDLYIALERSNLINHKKLLKATGYGFAGLIEQIAHHLQSLHDAKTEADQ